MNNLYTITAFSENHIGLLNRITIIFTRRHVNIESLTVSASSIEGIHKFTIVVDATEEQVIKITKQIEKLVEVLKSFYYTNDEIIYQEVALYKVSPKIIREGFYLEDIVRKFGVHILEVCKDFIVIEKTGHPDEINELFATLQPYSILQFTRSGRISVTRDTKEYLTSYLKTLKP